MISLQAKTVEYFRKEGYVVAPVERRKQFPDRNRHRCNVCGNVPLISVRHDLWNCFDLLACRPDRPFHFVLIQTTNASNHAMRRTKVLTSPEARFWVMAGGAICIQSWRKIANRWQQRSEFLSLGHFPRNLPETVEQFYESRRRENLGEYPQGTSLFKQDEQDEVPF